MKLWERDKQNSRIIPTKKVSGVWIQVIHLECICWWDLFFIKEIIEKGSPTLLSWWYGNVEGMQMNWSIWKFYNEPCLAHQWWIIPNSIPFNLIIEAWGPSVKKFSPSNFVATATSASISTMADAVSVSSVTSSIASTLTSIFWRLSSFKKSKTSGTLVSTPEFSTPEFPIVNWGVSTIQIEIT